MRNASRFLAVVGVAVALVAAATPASAVCPAPKKASSFTADVTNYVYFDLGPGTTASQLKGSIYSDVNNHTGTYGPNEWAFVDLGGKFSIEVNLQDARVIGCPSTKAILRLQAATPTGVRFLTATALEGQRNPGGGDFDFSFGRAPATVIPSGVLPRPRVNTSARAGAVVNLNFAIDPMTAANSAGDSSSAVTGYDIVRASGADPGRDAAGWTFVQTVTTSNGGGIPSVPLAADCSNVSVDQFFAVRAVMGASKSEVVSDSTRVNCNPALAEPRFNVVPKKPTGPKKSGTRE